MIDTSRRVADMASCISNARSSAMADVLRLCVADDYGEFETGNIYLALMRAINVQDAASVEELDRHTEADVNCIAAEVAKSVLAEDFSVRGTPGKLRLNGTTAESPEVSAMLMDKSKTASVRDDERKLKAEKDDDREENVTSRARKRSSAAREMSKAERRTYVLARVSARFKRGTDDEIRLLLWLLLSPATPSWKMAVYDNCCPTGSLVVAGLVLSKNCVKCIIVKVASRYMIRLTDKEVEVCDKLHCALSRRDTTCAISLAGIECFNHSCESWLSRYRLYAQVETDAHVRFLTNVSAIAQLRSSAKTAVNGREEQNETEEENE